MSDRRERVAWAIAVADPDQCGQIDSSEMGVHFWEKYRERYLVLADAAIAAMSGAAPECGDLVTRMASLGRTPSVVGAYRLLDYVQIHTGADA